MPKPIEADCLKELDGIRHGFFTREGGVSAGIYASLNCGLGSADRRDAVVENRARVARHLGASGEHVVTLHQVHSATAHLVDGPIPRERLPRADAVVTATRRLAVGALAADCAPILFADAQARVVAAAHAGWRGAVGGVVEAAVAAMIAAGAARERIRAAVGPCIGADVYEVGPEFESEVAARDPASVLFFARAAGEERPRFDLPGYVEQRLRALGLAAVERCAPCTYRNESLFFSYRRACARGEPDYGRQISAIVVA